MTEANYTAIVPACACGGVVTKVFKSGKFGKYCDFCRDKQRGKFRPGKREVKCVMCGTTVVCGRTDRKFCSARCQYLERDRRESLNGFTRAEYLSAMSMKSQAAHGFNCEQCGKETRRRLSGTNKARGLVNRFCSLRCRCLSVSPTFDLTGPKNPQFCRVFIGQCAECMSPFMSRRPRKCCSDACYTKRSRTAPATKDCKCCGEGYQPVYTGGGISNYCGKKCRELVAAAVRRTQRAKRSALLAGATVERVDPFVVFDRDNWRCQLCSIRTPRSKRGTYDDNAPELDHIIPLARGGEHSYRNTQCACRKCNGLKSDRPRGQLLLIG